MQQTIPALTLRGPPPRMTKSNVIHHFSDGIPLKTVRASELIKYNAWKGNRTLDVAHVDKIEQSLQNIQSLGDQIYTIATWSREDDNCRTTESAIIDGQHRAQVLNRYFAANPNAEDFIVLIRELFCKSEDEIINQFRLLNAVKPIDFKEDENMIANKQLSAIIEEFGVKNKFIRPQTRRPYLSSEKLREELIKQKPVGDPQDIAKRARDCNTALLETIRKKTLETQTKVEKHSLKIGFALSLEDKISWITLT